MIPYPKYKVPTKPGSTGYMCLTYSILGRSPCVCKPNDRSLWRPYFIDDIGHKARLSGWGRRVDKFFLCMVCGGSNVRSFWKTRYVSEENRLVKEVKLTSITVPKLLQNDSLSSN